ncbi:uncharacterized protein LOC122359259 isoform X2 [Puntigrus tetrazona]|uniref:uncharacterized protein LOC122359259 isoform X2 n=1 Tax=Puntigrus tetrazona TaxID=1606681 RepID=UPI001C891D36|nr:uncharacterized protein LOC122359259 isoform X2 [Puntigrus tetrazona]
MTLTALFALFTTVCFAGLVPGDAAWSTSVCQIPEIATKEGADVTITCHIKTNSSVQRVMVKWLRDNQAVSKTVLSAFPSPVNGSVFFNATLQLQSVRLHHSGIYYCTAQSDIPTLGSVEYGNGTYLYVAVKTPDLTPGTLPPIAYNSDTVRWSVLSGLAFILLVICTACVIHIRSKGRSRIEPRAKEALVDATGGSQCPDTHVVYAALKIPRDGVKSRNENCPAVTLTSVICTEESVTYSEVHIKKGPKDEG